MATIDYKEKYERAMERARQFFEKPYLEDSAGIVRYIFPELAESEDERMWKLIKKYAHCNISDMALNADHITREQLESWLEKQGKTSPILSNSPNIGKVKQKSVDKIEPKFKVGNKIKLAKEPKYPAREIIAIQNDAYYFDEAIYLPFSRQDEWELVEQNPAWSEEDDDDAWLNDIISKAECNLQLNKDEINWLKSLRPQTTWKPSEEQMNNK